MRRRLGHGRAPATNGAPGTAQPGAPRVRGPLSTASLSAVQRAAGNHAASSLAIQREVIGTHTFVKGTQLFHGTKGDKQWWLEDPFPNKEGEDGGLSFTLDPNASPKTRNATMLLVYAFNEDVKAEVHDTKGSFRKSLQADSSAVCHTAAEAEVVMSRDAAEFFLDFVEARPQKKGSTGGK